ALQRADPAVALKNDELAVFLDNDRYLIVEVAVTQDELRRAQDIFLRVEVVQSGSLVVGTRRYPVVGQIEQEVLDADLHHRQLHVAHRIPSCRQRIEHVTRGRSVVRDLPIFAGSAPLVGRRSPVAPYAECDSSSLKGALVRISVVTQSCKLCYREPAFDSHKPPGRLQSDPGRQVVVARACPGATRRSGQDSSRWESAPTGPSGSGSRACCPRGPSATPRRRSRE